MMQIMTIIIAALLSENYVLVKFLGICPFMAFPSGSTAQ